MKKKSLRPDQKKPASIFWKTILTWDLLLAGITGVGLGIAWLFVDKLQGGTLYLWPLLAASFAIAALAWNMGRHASDRTKDSDFGELVRIIDPDESAHGLPYFVVTWVSIGSGICTTIVAVLNDGIETRWIKALLYGIVALGFTWTVLGLISLVRIARRQDRNRAKVQSLREKLEADEAGRPRPDGGVQHHPSN